MKHFNVIATMVVASVALVLTGCNRGGSPNMVKIRGTVTYNGQPLTQGTVVYVPQGAEGRQARGEIQPDGSYVLTSLKDGDGAQQGDYVITVVSLKPHPGEPTTREEIERTGGRIVRESAIPDKYSNPATSGLADNVTKKHPGTKDIALTD